MSMFTPEKIKELRHHLEMTTTEFAFHLGVADQTVRMWECGKRHPNYARMVQLNEMAKKHKFMVPA